MFEIGYADPQDIRDTEERLRDLTPPPDERQNRFERQDPLLPRGQSRGTRTPPRGN